MSRKLLVVVHPGSACGSADFNLGRTEAEEARELLAGDLAGWQGGIVVIDGSLSEELGSARFRELHDALAGALACAAAGGLISHREWGCDDVPPHQTAAIRTVARKFALDPSTDEVHLTGCWFDPSDQAGCVNDVRKALRKLGFDPQVLPGAVRMLDDEADHEFGPGA